MNHVFANRLQKAQTQAANFPSQSRQVHTITDRFALVNTHLIVEKDNRVVVVDPGTRLNVHMLAMYLQQFLHLTLDAIDLVVLTYLHFDDSACMEALRRVSRAPIAASASALFQTGPIDIWLENVAGLPAHPNWRVIATPGKVPESLCLYNPFSYELLCGDTLTVMDNGISLLHGGPKRQRAQETLRLLRSLEVRYLYPGHGRSIMGQAPLNNVEIE